MALKHIRQQGDITTKQYKTITGISERQALDDLNALVSGNLIVRVGSGRSTHYVLVSKTEMVRD